MPVELLQKKYGNVVEGPTGVRMPEHVARAIEAVKGLPAGVGYKRLGKSADLTIDDNSETARTEVSVITTSDVDRDDEVVLPDGGDWAEFKRNPVVTFDHQYDELPVGTCQWIKSKKGGDGLIAKTLYPAKPVDWGDAAWMPSAIWHLINQDPPVCAGKSIGFMPLSVTKATSEEISKRPELKGKAIIRKWIGLEYACTPMPCNPNAGVITVEKEFDVDEHIAELVTKTYRAKVAATKGLLEVAPDAMQEAADNVASLIPYYTLEQFRYALARRLNFTDEHRDAIRAEIVDQFDRALGVV